MTEAEAWREIARRIVEGEWNQYGLCREVWRLLMEAHKAPLLFLLMTKRLRCHTRGYGWAYFPSAEPQTRALAALWMALEAEEEAA
jgi:hypothetical protein